MAKIRSIEISNFKRFEHLTVRELPDSARLVVLAGPNGMGKSSLFDSFRLWMGHHAGKGWNNDLSYYGRAAADGGPTATSAPRIEFHGAAPGHNDVAARKMFYIRTAYRNEPHLQMTQLSKVPPVLEEPIIGRMIEGDAVVSRNYLRLISNGLDDAFGVLPANMLLGDFRERVIGDLRCSFGNLFPNLTLNTLGSPLVDPTFRFTKGTATDFDYKNLSGGEKSIFDLLLDLVVKRRDYDDTVYCIDEPEAHTNPRVQGPLLRELLSLIPDNCQLWIATHAIGMLREARNIENRAPGTVVFLDFEDQNFDGRVDLSPAQPTRIFWERALKVALDDLADLVAPREVVVCEGNPGGPVQGKNTDHDARCYAAIFGDNLPEVVFVSGGNSHDVAADRLGFATKLPAIVTGTSIRLLIDRDDHAPADVDELTRKGITVLGRRNIQSYLYADEVLRALCNSNDAPELADELIQIKQAALAAAERPDDLKLVAGEIFNCARRVLRLVGGGNDTRAFERNTLAPLIRGGMEIYDELRSGIFT